MGVNLARTLAGAARYGLARTVLLAGVTAALTAGAAGPFTAAQTMAAAAPVTSSDPLAAWGITALNRNVGTQGLAVNPVTGTVYIDGEASGNLSVLDALTGQTTGTITLPTPPGDQAKATAVDPETDTVYAITGSATVAVISGKTDQVTTTIADASSPSQLAVDPETDTIYVLNSSTVSVIDGTTNTLTTTIDVGEPLLALAVDPSTNTIYVTSSPGPSSNGSVSVIDGVTNTVTTSIGVGKVPDRITADPVTDMIYVDNLDSGTISEIDGSTKTVTATLDVPAGGGLAVDPKTDTIYALNLDGTLSAINGRTSQSIMTSLQTSLDPDAVGQSLAVDPAAGTVYVTVDSSDFDGETPFLAVITSCQAHVVPRAGSNCGQLAAKDFTPAAVSFSSPDNGVALGTVSCPLSQCEQVVMMATADGGKHWSFLSPPPDLNFFIRVLPPSVGLQFTGPDDGWVFGSWHTRDGGATWQQVSPGIDTLAMAATSARVYAAIQPVRGHGELFATPIGATTWTKVPAVDEAATAIAVFGHSVWVTSARHLWHSADGRHWQRYQARCPGTGYRLAGVTATSPSRVALLCARPAGTSPTDRKEILLSGNGGRTVHLAGPAPATGIPQAFASPPGDPRAITIGARVLGPSGTFWIYHSADGGRTWARQRLAGRPDEVLNSLTFTTRATGWIDLGGPEVGDRLLHTTNSGRTWQKATF